MTQKLGTMCGPAAVLAAVALMTTGLAVHAAADSELTRASAALPASYHKDDYLPQYAEGLLPEPTVGGRMTIVGVASASGAVTGISVDGVTIDNSTDPPKGNPVPPPTGQWAFDWGIAYPNPAVAGKPMWVKFHSRDSKWDASGTANVVVQGSGGPLLSGSFATGDAARAAAYISYVAPTAGYAALIVHVQNNGSSAVSVTSAALNGAAPNSTVSGSIPARGHGVWHMELPAGTTSGSLYTLVVEFASGPPAVAAGRVPIDFFPIEHWPKSKECPVPGGNDTNYAYTRAASMDTIFISGNSVKHNCDGPDDETIVNVVSPEHDFWTIPSADGGNDKLVKLTNISRVAGILLADEPDGEIGPQLRQLAAQSQELWQMYEWAPTYIGGKTSRLGGAFSSITDVKGIDMYIAGCAPHITPWGVSPPPIASFWYSRSVRRSQMPGVVWPYYQFIDDGWDSHALGYRCRQPDANEIAVQAWGAVASGGKGVFIFQSELTDPGVPPEGPRWQAAGLINCQIGALRELLRTGDPMGTVSVNGGGESKTIIAEAIMAPGVIVLVVVNTENSGGYSDELCAVTAAQHWTFKATTVKSLDIPAPAGGFTIGDSFEVLNGAIADGPAAAINKDGSITVSSVDLGTDYARKVGTPIARTFVFAEDKGTRDQVSQGLAACNPSMEAWLP